MVTAGASAQHRAHPIVLEASEPHDSPEQEDGEGLIPTLPLSRLRPEAQETPGPLCGSHLLSECPPGRGRAPPAHLSKSWWGWPRSGSETGTWASGGLQSGLLSVPRLLPLV